MLQSMPHFDLLKLKSSSPFERFENALKPVHLSSKQAEVFILLFIIFSFHSPIMKRHSFLQTIDSFRAMQTQEKWKNLCYLKEYRFTNEVHLKFRLLFLCSLMNFADETSNSQTCSLNLEKEFNSISL